MATGSQKKATKAYRVRSRRSGLVRVEVQTRKEHSDLIKSVAKTLREDPAAAFEVRKAIKDSSQKPPVGTSLFDMFAGLPDVSGPEFDEIFDQPRDDRWREIDL